MMKSHSGITRVAHAPDAGVSERNREAHRLVMIVAAEDRGPRARPRRCRRWCRAECDRAGIPGATSRITLYPWRWTWSVTSDVTVRAARRPSPTVTQRHRDGLAVTDDDAHLEPAAAVTMAAEAAARSLITVGVVVVVVVVVVAGAVVSL